MTLAFSLPFLKPQLDYGRMLGAAYAEKINPLTRQALGYNALLNNTTGGSNTAVGYGAGPSTEPADGNTDAVSARLNSDGGYTASADMASGAGMASATPTPRGGRSGWQSPCWKQRR